MGNRSSTQQVKDAPPVTLTHYPGLLRCWEKFESDRSVYKETLNSQVHVVYKPPHIQMVQNHFSQYTLWGSYASVKDALNMLENERCYFSLDWKDTLIINVDKNGNATPLLEISLSGWYGFAQRRIEEWKSKNDPLEPLNLNSYPLRELPPLPENLEILNCKDNHLTSLPDLPTSLKILNCYGNKLKKLPTLPDGLKELNCGHNELKNLPSLPPGLTILACRWNSLKRLPILPETLTTLDCGCNELEVLPRLPSNLTYLDCALNALVELPRLPPRLVILRCNNNSLKSLLPLRYSPQELHMSDHHQFEVLPSTLSSLDCAHNILSTIPDNNVKTLRFEKNPALPLKIHDNSYCATYCTSKGFMNELRKKEAELERARCISRCAVIKEELLANRCAPERVEWLLTQGLGLEEALEMLGMGS